MENQRSDSSLVKRATRTARSPWRGRRRGGAAQRRTGRVRDMVEALVPAATRSAGPRRGREPPIQREGGGAARSGTSRSAPPRNTMIGGSSSLRSRGASARAQPPSCGRLRGTRRQRRGWVEADRPRASARARAWVSCARRGRRGETGRAPRVALRDGRDQVRGRLWERTRAPGSASSRRRGGAPDGEERAAGTVRRPPGSPRGWCPPRMKGQPRARGRGGPRVRNGNGARRRPADRARIVSRSGDDQQAGDAGGDEDDTMPRVAERGGADVPLGGAGPRSGGRPSEARRRSAVRRRAPPSRGTGDGGAIQTASP